MEPKKRDWDTEIKELETFFATAKLPVFRFTLDDGVVIINVPQFLNNHLATVKFNNGNKTFLPYLQRLQQFKRCLLIHELKALKGHNPPTQGEAL